MAAPVINPINGVAVPSGQISIPAGKSRIVPLTATDADGDPVSFSATSDQAGVRATVLSGGPFLKMTVAGKGDMLFQLLPTFAPETVTKIVNLVESGYYNGLTFHRIVPNFVVQGGDPRGDGTGGPGFTFDDEFHPQAIFSGNGQLAMANSGKDTNGSQFFVTLGTQRFLDFNHTIFGQLVRGFEVLADINDDPNSGSAGGNRPVTPIVITSASIVANATDAVLLLESTTNAPANVTLTANDGTPGGLTGATIRVVPTADGVDDPAILGPVTNQVTATNTAAEFTLTGMDLENQALSFAVTEAANTTNTKSIEIGAIRLVDVPGSTVKQAAVDVRVTPKDGYRGPITLIAKVKQANATSRGSSSGDAYDTQVITLTVKDQTLSPTGVTAAGTAGATGMLTVARVTSDVPITGKSLTATISWGDGTTSVGTIVGSKGVFNVQAPKTYFRAGTYPISVSIRDEAVNATVTTTSQAVVSDSELTAVFASPQVIPGTAQVTDTIARFSTANLGANLSDLSATIDWGDGTTSSGTIAGGNGQYTVFGSKSYAGLGTYAVKVTVRNVGGASAEASGVVTVPNRKPALADIPSQTVMAGSTLTLTAAATDADPGQTLRYSLAPGAPEGATIDPVTGVFSWRPSAGPMTAGITVIATDNGSPALSDARTFTVSVQHVAPVVRVASTAVVKKRKTVAAFRVTFDGAIDPSTLGPFSDVALVTAGRDKKLGTRDDVAVRFRSMTYDPASRTLSLVPRKKLAAKGVYRIRATTLTDTRGRLVDLNGNGSPGGTILAISGKSGAIVGTV